jgi:SagB-type dehydrogenase family enzyme
MADPFEPPGIGDRFQRKTKYRRSRGHPAKVTAEPAEGRIELSEPQTEGGKPLWSIVAGRRSIRDFEPTPVSLEQVSQLLWAVQGISAREWGAAFRTVPSAGACYPLNTYVVANRVGGLDPGLYAYDVEEAALRALRRGDLSRAIAAACLDQDMAAEAAVVFVWTAVPERSKQRYHQRAYRYIYLDAGHVGQSLHLAAEAMGLGCCAIGALLDDEVNGIVGADGTNETTVYVSVVGVPRRS